MVKKKKVPRRASFPTPARVNFRLRFLPRRRSVDSFPRDLKRKRGIRVFRFRRRGRRTKLVKKRRRGERGEKVDADFGCSSGDRNGGGTTLGADISMQTLCVPLNRWTFYT